MIVWTDIKEKTMKFEYTNTREQLYDYTLFNHVRSNRYAEEVKTTKRIYFYFAIFIVVWGLISLIRYFSSKEVADLSNAASSFFVAIFTYLFSYVVPRVKLFFTKRQIRKAVEKDPKYDHIAPVSVNIDARNISWTCGKEKGSMKLTEEMYVTESATVYYVENRKFFLVIPKETFTPEEESQFRKMLNVDNREKRK